MSPLNHASHHKVEDENRLRLINEIQQASVMFKELVNDGSTFGSHQKDGIVRDQDIEDFYNDDLGW
jgi:hypothetical protein